MADQYFHTPGIWETITGIWSWFWPFFSFLFWKLKFVWLILIVVYLIKRKLAFKLGMYEKKCPGCAEYVKGEAKVCRHCHTVFDDVK